MKLRHCHPIALLRIQPSRHEIMYIRLYSFGVLTERFQIADADPSVPAFTRYVTYSPTVTRRLYTTYRTPPDEDRATATDMLKFGI